MGSNHPIDKPIIFFDGVCNLCNSSIQFVIKRDVRENFVFSSLQSRNAQKYLPNDLSSEENLKSIVLKAGDKTFVKSSAVLTIARELPGLWPLLYVFILIPRFIRDWVYDIIAKNRYKWFGKKDQCMIPSPELKRRFID